MNEIKGLAINLPVTFNKDLGKIIIYTPDSDNPDIPEQSIITNITINNQSPITISVGETVQLSYEIIPDSAEDKRVVWSSVDDDYVTVTQDGKIIGNLVTERNILITCESLSNSDVHASIYVKVVDNSVPENPEGTIVPGNYITEILLNNSGSEFEPENLATYSAELSNSYAINYLKQHIHRYICSINTEGLICAQLNDEDSTKYQDGTEAPVTSEDYETMVKIPEFWYELKNIEDEEGPKISIKIATYNVDGFNHYSGSFVGAYKGFLNSTGVHSVYGKIPNSNSSLSMKTDTIINNTKSRNSNLSILNFIQNSCINMLILVDYVINKGTCDVAKFVGIGNSGGVCGNTNIKDTTTEDEDVRTISHNNIWGLEDWLDVRGEMINQRCYAIDNDTYYLKETLPSDTTLYTPYWFVSGQILKFDCSNGVMIPNGSDKQTNVNFAKNKNVSSSSNYIGITAQKQYIPIIVRGYNVIANTKYTGLFSIYFDGNGNWSNITQSHYYYRLQYIGEFTDIEKF